jgi:hypothetical protein
MVAQSHRDSVFSHLRRDTGERWDEGERSLRGSADLRSLRSSADLSVRSSSAAKRLKLKKPKNNNVHKRKMKARLESISCNPLII